MQQLCETVFLHVMTMIFNQKLQEKRKKKEKKIEKEKGKEKKQNNLRF